MLPGPLVRCYPNWMRLSRDFRDALNLFFGPRYADGMYLEVSFLLVAQALEVFHRTKYPAATVILSDEYANIRTALIKATPKQHRNLVSARLNHGNDPFFKTRIVEVVHYSGPSVTSLG